MNKQKIVITGGLGYIGFELCKLYSGETRYKNIVVIDREFFPSRVKQLRNWGFEFIQTSTTNQTQIEEIVKTADIVHHFSGITDVPRTTSEVSVEKEKEIFKVGIESTNNILNAISDKCKLIFPSTHVIFEGLTETKFDIDENEQPCPILSYAKVKYQNELDIINSNKNYVIFRLASVYGLSEDNTRLNIMPNLFSKMASQDLSLKLFAGGKQYKSLVSVVDVARAFKFAAESSVSNQIFNLCNENLTVKQVAELCKKHKPDVNLIETDDKIPNLGYTLTNKKLINIGFKFLYNIDTSIKEMITAWSKQFKCSDLEYIINSGNDYIDSRGKITNYELTEPINLIGYIESKKGTVRANHYHPIQEQKCLLIKGKYISVIKDLSDPNSSVQTRIIKEGDIAVIQPNVAHTMVFLEDSIFLNLVRGDRDHENYGVTHTIPYKLVNDEFRNNLLNHYSTSCRSSDSNNLRPVLSLGLSPLANNLLNSKDDTDELYPLEITYCPDSHNCQLSYVVPANKMFDNYLYVSSTTKTFRDHFATAADKYIDLYKLNSESLVVDIGSNDGIALKPLKEKGIKVVGVEPAKNIADIANKHGINTINDYFTNSVCESIVKNYGYVDLVTASNVFAHADGLSDIVKNVFKMLKPDGTFIIEVQYLLDTIKDLTFDNIYHEHVNYWCVTSLDIFFKKLGLYIVDVEHINTHGGSIRVYVKQTGDDIKESVLTYLKNEEDFGLKKYDTYVNFAKRVEEAKNNVISNIKMLKNQGYVLVGYGSPAKATTALNYFGITSNEIDYIIEDNNLKHNKFVPGVKIPIVSKDRLNEYKPDVIIVMAWNFIEEIKRNNKDLISQGIYFISIKDLQNNQFMKNILTELSVS